MDGAVTLLLREWQGGNEQALNQLMPLVYDQLRGLARHYMRGERQEHTLRPTAVVHEAYLRLADTDAPFSDRVHFYAVAATVMRHILLDWAKSHRRAKRGGGAINVELEENSAISWDDPESIVEIDRLLERLTAFDARKAKITEMIFFGGMTYVETAEFLGISDVTVHRELKMAKAWMFNELNPRKAQATK
jgi:RNA polymerase sigma factor (TIGR02999 family)